VEVFNILKIDPRKDKNRYYSVESVIITAISSKLCITVNEPLNMEYLYENKLDYPAPRALVKEIWIKIPQEIDVKKGDIDFYIVNNPCFPVSKKLKIQIRDERIKKAFESLKNAKTD